MVLQKEEVESGEFLSLATIHAQKNSLPFTPDGLYVLDKYQADYREI